MNYYYALFLNKNSEVGKYLSLIKYISDPKKKTLPHITLRVFKDSNNRLNQIKDTQVTYLNLIEPGAFNIKEQKAPYVVYIQCESEELEGIEYKPDYPFSRLHITLYEGNDYSYATRLYTLLKENRWLFKLNFEQPQKLSENRVGNSISNKAYIESIFNEILGLDNFIAFQEKQDNDIKLNLVKIILDKLDLYLSQESINITEVQSIYSGEPSNKTTQYEDQSEKNITYRDDNQLSFDDFYSGITPKVNKPVQDAIYVTPPEYAKDMAECALSFWGEEKEIDFGDSAVGTGALFLALKHLIDSVNKNEKKNYKINSAIGIDIDEEMAREAFIRCNQRGLSVIYGDAISTDVELGPKRNIMLVNPPYNRHQDIPYDYRLMAKGIAEEQTGIKIMGDAGLYVYHLLIMDKWLADEGIGVWLLPTIFLQSRYGDAVRQYLINNVELLQMHIYDDETMQFDNTHISTTIVTFKKLSPEKALTDDLDIIISCGDSTKKPLFKKIFKRKLFLKESDNWRKIIYGFNDTVMDSQKRIRFKDLFDIKRGLATGANSFFVMGRQKAKDLGIPYLALKPLLPKARYLKSKIVDSDEDGYPMVTPQLVLIDCDLDEKIIEQEYPEFYHYLQTAEEVNNFDLSIKERTLIKKRKPWYKQEKRDPPPYLMTYMGRNKINLPPLYFILNKSNAVALNTYILLYPKDWLISLLNADESLYESLLEALNSSAEHIISQQTRVYAGGLQKLEPGELKDMYIINLPEKISNNYEGYVQT